MSVITHPLRLAEQGVGAIYVAAAVRNATSSPMAVLVFEIDPVVSFYQIFRKSAFSGTGEAYAFDRDGLLLTPGRNFAAERLRPTDRGQATLLGENNNSLPGYETTPLADRVGLVSDEVYIRNAIVGYDGQLKVGAWIWDKQFQMGLALEQTSVEGLELLRRMQWIFLTFVGLVILIILSFFFILAYWSAARTRDEDEAREALVSELVSLHERNTLDIADREATHRAIIDTAWDAIFTVDNRGVILSANPATARIFGCRQDKLTGHLIEDWVWLDGRERLRADYMAKACGQAIEATGVHYDRRTFPVTVSIAETETSQSSFFTVIVRDVSVQKMSERSLSEARQRLEMSQSFAYIGTWEWDVHSDKVMATEMALKLNGLEVSRCAVGLGVFFSRINGSDRPLLHRTLYDSVRAQEPFSIECRVDYDDESSEWLLIQGTPLQEQGAVNRLIGHVQRITERKENEKALLAARNMLRLVLDTIPIGVYWKKADLTIAGVNKKFCQDLELQEKDIIGKTDEEVYCNRSQAALIERLDRTVVETGVPMVRRSGRYQMNNGKLCYVEISRLPIQDQEHNTLGMLGVYTDVTERLETQKSLQRHHKLLASIYSSQLRYFAGDNCWAVFSHLLREVLELAESEYGFIGQVLYKPDGQPYLRTYAITRLTQDEITKEWQQKHHGDGVEFHNLGTLLGRGLRTAKLEISNTPLSEAWVKDITGGDVGVRNFMAIPLLKGNDLVGMIGFANHSKGYDQELIRFLQPILTTCANLIAAIDSDMKIIATQQQLLRAKESAEKANRAKTDFLSRVSHELRTPMNAILGFTGLLTESAETEEQHSFLREIDIAGHHLMSLINEVLDLGRIESGRIELQSDYISLDSLLEECCSVTGQLAQQKGIQLRMHPDSGRFLQVVADVGRLRQILLNLLSNAIKYNKPEGSVTLNVQLSKPGQVDIHVQDTGIGLSEHEMRHLFESFNRLHAEKTDIEGTGMGLVITRQLAELMRGSLTVSSTKGEGSRFTLSLPGNSSIQENEGESAQALLLPARVLILGEENPADSYFPGLEAALISADPVFVNSGGAFLELALQHDFQLMICDSQVSDFSLEELLHYLSDSDVLSKTPVLIIFPANFSFSFEALALPEHHLSHLYSYTKGELLAEKVQDLFNFTDRSQKSY
ncbi:PAS domain S-box protein [Oceanospirillum linum]|uniref:histidine kinase n=1 Tax=Oceanospirillum linum TaxID=966 RepID=A0A1T1HAC2_OCELI|nr:PAS domain S-box protein [Oceanospirillum linum]OOV86801.1 hypothetical protein BTA35_0210900 [Oceanospirillum linum]SEG22077.1 PAS domain S-box-containing protein [Oleiphilus messinensis]SMP25251.1 PAS domain S-box-containing protein [Oceanospirillum linum]